MDQLAQCLENTISSLNDVRKPAERYLLEIEKTPGFGEGLFYIIMNNNYSTEIKVASAIAFKNFVKRNWKSDESNDDNISKTDREFIKTNIVELMLNNVSTIQNQLSEAVSIIGKCDFPDNWNSLLPQLISKIKEGNFNVINGVLRTCHSLFKRYQFESRSNQLWMEIKQVITQLGEPLQCLIQETLTLIEQNATDKKALFILWNSILLIEKIFLSLNYQDLPEYFEDNMSVWMAHFHKILLVHDPLLASGDSEEVGILEQVKSNICDIISLYARNYDEEFSKYISVFIEDILHVLVTATCEPKYDMLVANSLHFLSLVADRAHHRSLFVEKVNLQQLSQDIIIPNIEFHESDQELFLENPDEYIRRDIEGSYSESRRKSACELVKSLCRLFEQQVVSNFVIYIQDLLRKYTEDSSTNWKMKDSALFLITSVVSKGETGKHGVTSTTEFVDIKDFYKAHVLPELQGTMNGNPVIKADCIKYLMTFRSIIPVEDLREAINLLATFVSSQIHVVHSYAAVAINKLLMVKETGTNVAAIRADHISNPTAFIVNVSAAMNVEGSEDNIYLMQAMMRLLSTLQDKCLGCMNQLVEFLQSKLNVVVKNPRKPLFNHSLIESVALCVKIVCAADKSFVTGFEMLLCSTFNVVLCEDIEEFVPYAFQLFSLMLDQHPAQEITKPYEELFPFLVHPALWERLGNVPSLIRLLLSYLEKANWSIIADKLQNLITIFQKLNKSRALDTFGFSLITAIMLYVPRQHTEVYLRMTFESIFQRLTQNKTPKYLRGFVLFFNSLMLIYPPNDIVQLINKIQQNLFQMILENVLIPTLTKIDNRLEKKICVVGITRLVFESSEMTVGSYMNFRPALLSQLIELCATYTDSNEIDNEAHFVDIEITNTATSHSQLVFVGKKIVDPSVQVTDPRMYLANSVKQLMEADLQQFRSLYSSLNQQVLPLLSQLMSGLGFSL